MDIEAPLRRQIVQSLDTEFYVLEEVGVSNRDGDLRADLVAIPKDDYLDGAAIAFEVKAKTEAMNFQNWSKVFKQAADYVNSIVVDARLPRVRIAASFVFPSPPYVPHPALAGNTGVTVDPWYRSDQLLQYAGMHHLAMQFRVGRAEVHKTTMTLSMGPQVLWVQGRGWFPKARDLLFSSRIGSRVQSRP